MTIRAEIIGGDIPVTQGWVEVDPFDYEYTGKDPSGEITAYLDGIANGTVEFRWPEDFETDREDYPPELKLIKIMHKLQYFDDIWFVELPEDFEGPTIAYE
jgi:hypothetical protein